MNKNMLSLLKGKRSEFIELHFVVHICTVKTSLHSFNVFHYVFVQSIFNLAGVLQYSLITLIPLRFHCVYDACDVRLSLTLMVKFTINEIFSKRLYHNSFFKEMGCCHIPTRTLCPRKAQKYCSHRVHFGYSFLPSISYQSHHVSCVSSSAVRLAGVFKTHYCPLKSNSELHMRSTLLYLLNFTIKTKTVGSETMQELFPYLL